MLFTASHHHIVNRVVIKYQIRYDSNMQMTIAEKLRTVDHLMAMVGQTPMLEIHYRLEGQPRRIFAKYEISNMTGSIKDRMALHILRRAYESGELQSRDTIVEASSGNTGISFAAIGKALGHFVRIYMPDWLSQERVLLMHHYGAEVIPVSKSQGGFIGSITMANDYAHENEHVYLPRQFDNPANTEAHELTTGPEIEQQLQQLGYTVDAVVAGVGTGGTIMGVARYLRSNGKRVQAHPLEPANSPTMRTGHKVGQHRIQGISDEFIPSIVNLQELDPVVDVWDGDAILMAQTLCHQLGLAVGISSGANVVGAMQVAEHLGPGANVVTIIADCNKKYFSTALCHAEPPRDEYWTPRIKFDHFSAIR
ncbi:MAG: Cysteine synthase [Phycisphaerae bacterium]|nr:Cysteine synthase [Phycisphaerae bacterium]